MRSLALVLPILCFACGRDSAAKAPLLPGLVLTARTGELQARVDAAPKPPDERRMAALLDLLETAYLPGSPLAARAKRSLQEEESVVWILEQGLTHADAAVRMFSAYDLSSRGRPASIPPLLLRLKYETEPTVKVWVVDALCRLGNDAAVLELISLMQRPDCARNAGQTAIHVLKRADRDPGTAVSYPELIQMLPAVHRHWVRTGKALGFVDQTADEAGDPAGHEAAAETTVDPLLHARIAELLLSLESFQLRPVDDARFVLMRSGIGVVADLSMAVTAEETYLRNHALEVLRDIGRLGRPAGAHVLPLLGDRLSGPLAARTLGAIGAADAYPYLVEAVRGTDLEIAASAAAGLGLLGDPRGRDVLAPMVADETASLDLRVQAAFGLALLSPGVEFLRERQRQGDFHAPTVDELLDEIGQRVRRREGR